VKGTLLAVALLVLISNAGEAWGARQAAATPRVGPGTLLAAAVPWSTVQAVAGESYWPELPGFNTIVDQEDPQPLTAVSQTYRDISGNAEILTRLYAFASSELSLQFLQSSAIVIERIDQDSPAIGDEHFYYVTTLPDGRTSTRFFFIRGAIGATIQIVGAGWSRDRIARLAGPIDERIQKLLAGQLPSEVVPGAQLARLPASGSAPGRVLGTASLPAEAWATVVHKGSPRTIRNNLVRSGNATFPFRRYLRQGSATDVLEVTVFSFGNTGAAQAWFAPFAAGVSKHPADALNPGATGDKSAFRFELDNFELQFVAGRYVADVFCWSPFVATASPQCEAATRTLAERWYAQLGHTSE
jgi:hypothetical protein